MGRPAMANFSARAEEVPEAPVTGTSPRRHLSLRPEACSPSFFDPQTRMSAADGDSTEPLNPQFEDQCYTIALPCNHCDETLGDVPAGFAMGASLSDLF